MKIRSSLNEFTLTGLFAAIIFILAFTPIGYIQLPFIKATIIHIPVIIASILLGPKYGSILGFLFGVTSLISNTVTPTISSFVFSPFIPMPNVGHGSPLALIICFVPRILVGILPWFVYNGLKKLCTNKWRVQCLAAAGIIGSLTNTVLVMNLIFLFFRESYADVKSVALDVVYKIILSIIVVNGIPEAILAGVLTAAICLSVKSALKKI